MLVARTYAVLVSLSLAAGAQQTAEVVVMGQEPIPELGVNVQGISRLSINDSGDWIAHVGGTIVLDDDGVVAQSFDNITDPVGTIDDLIVRLTNEGDTFRTLTLVTASDSTVIQKNDITILRASDPVNAPGVPLSATYESLAIGSLDGTGRHMLVHAKTDEDALHQRSLFAIELDESGAIVSTRQVTRTDDTLPEDVEPVSSAAGTINRHGDYFFGAVLGGWPDIQRVLYLNSTRIARAGQPSIVPGLNWGTFGAIDLNDSGEYVFVSGLTSSSGPFPFPSTSDGVIVKSGDTIVARVGQTHPAIAPAVFTELGGTVRMSAAGEVLFAGKWDGGEALFVDDELVVQTNAPGIPFFDLIDEIGGLEMSDNGRYIFVDAKLFGGLFAAVLIDRDGPAPTLCNGDGGTTAGCTPCPCANDAPPGTVGGCLNSAAKSASLLEFGRPSVGRDTQGFALEGAIPSSFAVLVSGVNALPNFGPCPPGSGLSTSALDGLRCVGGNLARHGSRATDSEGAVGKSTNQWGSPHPPTGGIVLDAGLAAGQTRHFQAFYREFAQQGCGTGQNTSNARSITATR